ncbi:MAG: PAS domain S-box protein [Pseudomonadota bacterium]
MKSEITLRTRLVMLVIAAIVPLFGLSLVGAVLTSGEAVSRATQNLEFSASLAAANQQRLADSVHQVLTAIASMPELDGKDPECQRYFKTLSTQLPTYSNLGIINADGYIRCHSVANNPPRFAGDRPYFQAAMAGHGFVAGSYLLGRISGKPIMTFALPVMGGKGEVRAVAFASMYLSEFSRAVAEAPLPEGSRLVVMDRNGIVLAANPEQSAVVGQPVPSPMLQDAIKAGTEGVLEGADSAGAAQIYAFLPSSKSADAPFFVAVSADRYEVVAPARKRLGLVFLALTLVAFFGSWIAWRMGGRAIVRPTTEILAATRQIQAGQLDVRIPARFSDGDGEFARIAGSFNLMTDALQQRQHELDLELDRSRQAYATLELTINSMDEGLMAVDAAGRFLLVNEPAQKLFSMERDSSVLTPGWSREQGLFMPGSETPLPFDETPLFRALQGESGGPMAVFLRNDRQPKGRLLSCSYRPMHHGSDIVGALVVFSDITEVDRLQMEQAASYVQLRETQRRLLDAQRLGRIGTWEMNVKTRKLWVSDELYDLYDIDRNTFDGTGEQLFALVHPEDRARYLQQRRMALAAGEPGNIEYRIITAAGETRWLNQYYRVQTDSEGQALHRTGVVQEITGRKRAELLIARSTELLNRTGALARVGGWELLTKTMTPYWSQEIYRIHEIEPQRDFGLDDALGFYAPEAQPQIRAAVDAALEHARPWDLELALVTAMGRRLWVRTQGRALLEDGKVARLVGVMQDLTEQRESQAHLRLLETSISRLNDMVLITEAQPLGEPGPRIVFVNNAFERHTGYSREEVLGKSPRLLQGPKTQRAELDRIGAALRSWQPVRSELINYTKAGDAFWVELEIVPITDARGWFTHWVAVERDITRRKRAEQALIDSEQRYAALFEMAPVPMWVYDIASCKFLTVNRAAVQGYGYSVQEFLSMAIFDIRTGAEQAPPNRALAGSAAARKEGARHRRKDGSLFPVNVVSQPIQYGGRDARFVVALDMTAQVNAEKDVQEYLFTLQRAADAAQAITWHQTLDGMLQEVAEQARGVIGSHQAMVSLTLDGDWVQATHALSLSEKYAKYRDLIVQTDGTGVYAMVCENSRAVRMTQAELEADPRWRGFGRYTDKHPAMCGWLAVPLMGRSGKNIGLLQLSDHYDGPFTLQDEYVAIELAQLASIAIENAQLLAQVNQLNAGLEQKVNERTVALARQEALFRTLAEQAPQVVWTVNPGGEATYFNRAWFELVGGTLEDWAGTKWFLAMHPEDLPDVKAGWEAAVANQSQFMGIRRVLSKDGSYHTMSYRASPVCDDQGVVVFWVGIDADITEIKAIEAALRLSNQELEAFSYSVSHDLRAPLNTIDGFSRLLSKQLSGTMGERGQHYLTRIQAGVAQMGKLIEDLLSLAQVSRMQLHYELVDLSALSRNVLKEWQARHPERQVVCAIEAGLLAHGDGRLVRLVMENLLGNAWKFTSQKTDASVQVGKKLDAAGLPVFFVSDNGAGFDMAYADKLFIAFQRLHSASEFPGTGVGLATVSRVIGRHGGRLWAEASPGRGATFYFTLPNLHAGI